MNNKYPYWVCDPCGTIYGHGKHMRISTWHIGVCEVCGQGGVFITEPRDFGYPAFPVGRLKKRAKRKTLITKQLKVPKKAL